MPKLYVTHRPAELVMALIQFECVIGGFYVAYVVSHPVVMFIVGQLAVLSLFMCWVFLFTMRGSREREEAAAAIKEPA